MGRSEDGFRGHSSATPTTARRAPIPVDGRPTEDAHSDHAATIVRVSASALTARRTITGARVLVGGGLNGHGCGLDATMS